MLELLQSDFESLKSIYDFPSLCIIIKNLWNYS